MPDYTPPASGGGGGAPSGAAGGGLAGTYPNPNLAVNNIDSDINGYLSWNFDLALGGTVTAALVSGTIYVVKVPWRYTADIATIDVYLTALGSTPTAGQCLAGIYNSSGTQVGTTGDIGSALTTGSTNAIHPLALTATASAVPGARQTYLWVALLFVGTAGPTLPKLNPNNAAQVNANVTGAAARSGTNGTTQTALPSPMTMANITAGGAFGFWAGLR